MANTWYKSKVKNHNDRFLKMYRAAWVGGNWSCGMWDSRVWKAAFGGSVESKLPENKETMWATVVSLCGNESATLKLEPLSSDPEERAKRRHRVFTQCDRCQQWVGVGRISQHKC